MQNSEIIQKILLVKIHILLIHKVLLTIYFQQHKHHHYIHRPNLVGYHNQLHRVEYTGKCQIFKINIHHSNERHRQCHPKEFIDSHQLVILEDLLTHRLKWHITMDWENRHPIMKGELQVHRNHIDMMQWMAQVTIHRIIQIMEAIQAIITHK